MIPCCTDELWLKFRAIATLAISVFFYKFVNHENVIFCFVIREIENCTSGTRDNIPSPRPALLSKLSNLERNAVSIKLKLQDRKNSLYYSTRTPENGWSVNLPTILSR